MRDCEKFFETMLSKPFTALIRKRFLHRVPKLDSLETFKVNGIKGLYSNKGFENAWINYQKYLTMNLSLLTVGTNNELKTPYQILLNTAKQSTEQHVFHFASQSHNNHFVFEQLASHSEAAKTAPSRNLLTRIKAMGFNSIDDLRDHMIFSANSAIGQGWVFLVEHGDKSLSIIKCNNDGTPYYYGKNQSLDLNGGVDESSFEKYLHLQHRAQNNDKDFTLPLLGLNFWDYAYINDYGINGKLQYLTNFWQCINWNVVNNRLFQL